jgi:DNA-binding HxlR family transcriptional regulator
MTLQVNSMTVKRTAEQAKQESENTVLRQLTIKSPQRWSDLLSSTRISSRTLKKALDRLGKKGFVHRQVEQGKDYPPPVLYGLSSKGREISDPIFFATTARPYILGLGLEWEAKGKNDFTIGIRTTVEDMEKRIAVIGRRLAAFYLFIFLKGIEEKNTDWVDEAQKIVDYDPFMVFALGLDAIKLQTFGEVEGYGERRLLRLPGNLEFTYNISREKLMELKKLLKKVYPEEIQEFEKILKANPPHKSNKKRKNVPIPK